MKIMAVRVPKEYHDRLRKLAKKYGVSRDRTMEIILDSNGLKF